MPRVRAADVRDADAVADLVERPAREQGAVSARTVVGQEAPEPDAAPEKAATAALGRKPKRLDCSRIYEFEIQRLRDELALLKMNAE